MASISPTPKLQFFAANGTPLVGGKLYSYAAGTTTPLATYTDEGAGTANPNPVILDSRGEASVWFGSAAYKLRLTTATDVDVWTVDDLNKGDAGTLALLAASGGSARVGFLQAGSGAQPRAVQDKLRDVVSVKDFGAAGSGLVSDTAAIQAALNTGKDVFFPVGDYLCANLTVTTAGQRLFSNGRARLIKNANGPICTFSGAQQQVIGVSFRGESGTPSFTGDNIVSTGDDFALINCGSRWAYGSAVVCTGNHVQIIGTCDIYQTATGAGFDIIIGRADATTFYHSIYGIRSTQSTGGIKLIAPGVCDISASQFGKLTVDPGASPGGMHGPSINGCRINGVTSVAVSATRFSTTSFSANVEFTGSITNVTLDSSCMMIAGSTLTVGPNVTNSSFSAAILDAGSVTIVDQGVGNYWTRGLKTYTPAWTSSGTAPTLGNGTLTGSWTIANGLVTVDISLTWGSTTSAGTGTWAFSLPFTCSSDKSPPSIGPALIFDSGTGFFVGSCVVGAATDLVRAYFNAAGNAAGAGVPITWATNDRLEMTISYPMA